MRKIQEWISRKDLFFHTSLTCKTHLLKQILLVIAIAFQHALAVSQTISLPVFIRCRDDVSAFLRSAKPEEVIHNDIDGKRFIIKVSIDSIYLGKVDTPGLYNIRVDTVDNYYFAYSCRDHVKKNSFFPLPAINIPCVAGTCHTDALNALKTEFLSRNTAFKTTVDTSGLALMKFVDSGQTIKLGFFFDIANGRIAVIGDPKNPVVPRATAVAMVETFFDDFFKKIRPDSTASNPAMVALMKLAVETVLPNGAPIDGLPNFRYAPFVIDDLVSTYTRQWVEGNMQGVALSYEARYAGQIIFLMSVSLPPKVNR
jgi:hypothetical protein